MRARMWSTFTAIVAAAAMSLGVAAPAQAVDVAPLSSYVLHVPPSVYSTAAGFTPEQSNAWRVAAAGTGPIAPVGPKVSGLESAIVSGGAWIIDAVADSWETISWFVFPGVDYESGEAFACDHAPGEGWFIDALNGLGDWTNDMLGIDCSEFRTDDDVKLPKPDGYVPQNVAAAPWYANFPVTVTAPTAYGAPPDTKIVWKKPFWSNVCVPSSYWGANYCTPTGWVYPIDAPPVFRAAPFTIRFAVESERGTGPQVTPGFPQYLEHQLGLLGARSTLADGSGCGADICLTPFLTARIVSEAISGNVMTRLRGQASGGSQQNNVPNFYQPSSTGYFGGSPLVMAATLPPIPGRLWLKAGGTPSTDVEPAVETGAIWVQLLTTVTGSNGSKYSCRTDRFKETDATVPQPCSPQLPGGVWETRRVVELVPQTDTGYVPESNPARKQWVSTPSPEYIEWRETYPGCAGTVCDLDLKRNGISCFDLDEACANWATDPARDSIYTCTYGGSSISIDECLAAYKPTFDPVKRAAGEAYTPVAGTPPGTPTSSSPGAAIPPGKVVADPEKARQCFPTGWAVLNPVEWVMKPVVCALESAFVARASVQDATTAAMAAAVSSSFLGQVGDAVHALADVVPSDAGGCGGIPLHLEMFGSVIVDAPLLNACPGDDLAPAAVVTKSILTFLVIAGAVGACVRYIAGIFSYMPFGAPVAQGTIERDKTIQTKTPGTGTRLTSWAQREGKGK